MSLVDCMEEFVKFTVVMKSFRETFADRFGEREEVREGDEEK